MERTEPLAPESDFERPLDPRRRESPRNFLWPLVMVAAVVVAALLFWRSMHPREAVVPPAPKIEVPAAPAAAPAQTPKYPVEATPAPTAENALPPLADSDAALRDALGALFGLAPIERIFNLQDIARRFVATIDNLPRQTVALQRMPVKPVGGEVAVTQSDGRILLRADNASRYAPYLQVLDQADPQKLVQTYVRFYPLFQKAYEELGYPNGYFNDRLVEVIDHLLAAPDVPAPIELAQPKVLYQFADPALEQRSAGQKIMIRLGPVGESHVKTKLRAIRKALTGQELPR